MRAFALVFALAVSLAPGRSEEPRFVSTALGVKLYETGDSNVLSFTIVNGMPATLDSYVIETWITGPRGIPVRSCKIAASQAAIADGAKATLPAACTLPADPQTGRAVLHSSRLTALRFANGWEWKPPVSMKVFRSGRRF